MRKLSKLKLNQLSKDELDQRQMNALKGGCICSEWCNCNCSSVVVYAVGAAGDYYINETTSYVYDY